MNQQHNDRIRERFDLIVNGPALFNAIISGLELGIFKCLAAHDTTSFSDLLVYTALRPEKLRVLLQALCATELIDKQGDAYINSEVAASLLVSDEEGSWLDILKGWQQIYYPAFPHMTTALREGTNACALSAYAGTEPTLYQRLEHDPLRQSVFHAAMGAFSMRSMHGLVEHPSFASVNHLLDIGGNDGTTARQLRKRYPNMAVTIFDLPTVTAEVFSEKSEEMIQLHPGHLFKDPFPKGADTILFSHVLEIFSEQQILFLLEKAFETLPLGGKIMLYGYNVSNDERRGLYSARLSLYLNILASGEGMAYPAKDWEHWLQEAGFSGITTTQGLPYEHGLTIAWKR